MSETTQYYSSYRRLIGKTVALFLSYFAVAMTLPVMSVHVIQSLHFGNALGGLAVGITFLSTILTRSYAGNLSDQQGGKLSMQRGLMLYSLANLICLISSWSVLSDSVGYAILIAGRLVLGLGESLTLVGMISWSIGLMGHAHSGRVIALMGMGMYGAFAAGGPIGLLVFQHWGFGVLMMVCIALPLIGLLLVRNFPVILPNAGKRESFWKILGRIGQQGAVVGLQGVGFAGLGAFFSLYFLSKNWPHGELGLTGFGIGFIAMRILCGHLPDKIGGTRVAIASLSVEAIGQCLIWVSPSYGGALLGAFLTGIGCSMVFPSMGVEVVKRIAPHLRGTALAGFAAFQDLAYGITGPIVGVFVDYYDYSVVFLIGGCAAFLGLCIALWSLRTPAR